MRGEGFPTSMIWEVMSGQWKEPKVLIGPQVQHSPLSTPSGPCPSGRAQEKRKE